MAGPMDRLAGAAGMSPPPGGSSPSPGGMPGGPPAGGGNVAGLLSELNTQLAAMIQSGQPLPPEVIQGISQLGQLLSQASGGGSAGPAAPAGGPV